MGEISLSYKDITEEERFNLCLKAGLENDKEERLAALPLPTKAQVSARDPAVLQRESSAGKRLRARCYPERAKINKENLRQHSLWSSGLGLGDCEAALKPEYMADKSADEAAKACSHMCAVVTGEELDKARAFLDAGETVSDEVCYVRYGGLCELDPLTRRARNGVTSVHRLLDAFDLKPGALLKFAPMVASSLDLASERFAFLGHVVHAPTKQHILLSARVEGNLVRFICDDAGVPMFTTSHLVFRDVLAASTEDAEGIACQELKFDCWPSPHFDGLPPTWTHFALTGEVSEFNISVRDPTRPRQRRGQLRVPFGLRVPPKRRERGPRGGGAPRTKKVRSRSRSSGSSRDSTSSRSAESDRSSSTSSSSSSARANPEISEALASVGKGEGKGKGPARAVGPGVIERAPTGRARCKVCGNCIDKHSLRIQFRRTPAQPFYEWVHIHCIVRLIHGLPALPSAVKTKVSEECRNYLRLFACSPAETHELEVVADAFT